MINGPPFLAPRQRAALLALARESIQACVRGTRSASAWPQEPSLQEPGAAFVTITRDGQLRGCVGYAEAIKPLAETIAYCAAAAATADPRFPPVSPEELPHIRVEVSVLSPLRRIEDPAEVQVGIHGLYICQSGRHGLLLPQVATEFGWDRDTFLRQACLKAGLPAHAWEHGAEVWVFTVDHFTDETPLEPWLP